MAVPLRRGRAAFVFLSLLATACQRAPHPTATVGPAPPLIVIGMDGADWQFIDPLVAAGRMPIMAQLLRDGQSGILKTQHPPLSPLVWTTMLTGKSPLEHRILDFTRFHPRTGEREPITSDERRVPAVWNMLNTHGRSAAVFGMWATYPAEAIDGVIVSDRLYSFQHREVSAPLLSVFPANQDVAAGIAVTRAEASVDTERLRIYLPWVAAVENDPLVAELRRILIQTEVYDALARQALTDRNDALTIVYFQGTDEIGHLFANSVPPRPEWVSQTQFARYAGVAERYYQEIDARLGAYRQLAAQRGARFLVVSDHGFRWGDDRPRQTGKARAATAAQWHRDDGIWLLWGAGIAPAPRAIATARIDQICATILAVLGLPSGVGLTGPPLASIASSDLPPIDYNVGYKRSDAADSTPNQDRLEQLEALGYVGTREPSLVDAAHDDQPTRTAGSFSNEALILRGAGRLDEAQRRLQQALVRDPHHAASLWNLSDLLAARGEDSPRSDALLLGALSAGLPDGVERVLARAAAVRKAGDPGRAAALIEGAVQRAPQAAPLFLYRARLRSEAQDCRGALADALTAQRWAPQEPTAYALAGVSRLCLGDDIGARRDLVRSLQLDPNQPAIREILDR